MDKLAKPLQSLLQKYGLQEQLEKRRYLRLWPAVVGRQIAVYTRPVNISRKKLTVEVNDSTWLYHLTLLKHKIIADFNLFVHEEILQEIIFVNADFKSGRLPLQKEEKENKYSTVDRRTVNRGVLKKEELEKIEAVVQYAPEFFQARLRSLYKNNRLLHNNKIREGAALCRRCGGLSFDLQENLCSFCRYDLEAWAAVLQNFFSQIPWGGFEEIHRQHPLLDAQLFAIYKKKLLESAKEQIADLMRENKHLAGSQKKHFKELVQNYILLVVGKEPPCIEQEDIFKALKIFPGLYQLLYV